MLISKEVKKLITPRVAKKYRDLGYDLPNNIPRKGIEIFVKVNDLPTNSKDKIQYECDNCHNVFYTEYGVYKSHLHEDNKYYCKYCVGKVLNSGSNCYRWKDNLTEEDRINRRLIPEHIEWSKKVLARDKYICRKCGMSNSKLCAHHLNSWNNFISQRYNVDNGVCLCDKCHYNFHSNYGFGNNTKEQYEEWIGKSIEDILDYNGNVVSSRKIICLETKEIDICKNFTNGSKTHIYDVCNGKANHYKNKHYMWYDEYINSSEEEIIKRMSLKRKRPNSVKVICIEKKLLFETLSDAGKYFNRHSSMISDVLNGKQNTFAGYHWCRLSEYQDSISELKQINNEERSTS